MDERKETKGPAWFTIKQAAEYLEVGEQTLYRWMREGKITYRKIGDATRFLKEDLEEVVQIFRSAKEAEAAKELCPLCHHDFLSAGGIRSTGLIYFRPDDAKFWSLRDANIKTSAKMCPNCGAITLFGDVAKLAKLRGSKPQPDAPDASPS
jgi:excisionase family DNA binding protein